MPHIKINLLGAMQVWVDDLPIRKFRSAKTAALLATLILEARPLPRTTLATRFWPDHEPEKAHNELRRCLSNLRRLLPNCIEANRETAVFTPPPSFTLDIVQIRDCYVVLSVESLREAARLCCGPLLEGFDLPDVPQFDRWLDQQRNQWQQTVVSLHQALITAATQQQDWQTAVWAANQLLRHAPAHEPTHRQLIRLYLRLNQRDRALDQLKQCKTALQQTLNLELSAESEWLHEQARSADSWQLHNLPQQSSSFVGRKDEIAKLLSWLNKPQVGIVAVSGPGGMGKTRLVQQVAKKLRGAFLHGIYWVDLEPLDDPTLLPNEIAKAVGIQLHGSDNPWERVLERLERKEMLLLLDNFEHLQRHLLANVQTIRQRAPQVKLLITSRQRLPLPTVRQLTLSGLGSLTNEQSKTAVIQTLPNPEKPRSTNPAMQLFLNRARQQRPSLKLTPHKQHIKVICTSVGGMPLALEMAAAWSATHTPKQIAARLQQTDDLLQRPFHDAAHRHFSIRTIFNHSWGQLSSDEQATFTQLAIFQGGFTHEAAQAVAQATDQQLVTLINHSLLQRDENGRYHFHPLILQFTREKLELFLNISETIERFASFFVFLLEKHNIIQGSNQALAIQQLTNDLANIHKLWVLLIQLRDFEKVARSVDAIWAYGELTGQMQEVDKMLQKALVAWQPLIAQGKRPMQQYALAALRLRHAWFGFRLSNFYRSRQVINQAFQIPNTLSITSLPDIRPHLYYTKALLEWYLGEFQTAHKNIDQCLELSHTQNDLFAQNLGFQLFGFILEYQGHFDQALDSYLHSNKVAILTDDQRGHTVNHSSIARMYLNIGKVAQAQEHLSIAETLVPKNDPFVLTFLRLMQGLLEIKLGHYEIAQSKIEKSIQLAQVMNDNWMLAFSLNHQTTLHLQAEQLESACGTINKSIALNLEMKTRPLMLEAIATAVFILQQTNQPAQASQLAHVVFHHPATPAYARQRVKQFVNEPAGTTKSLPDLWQTAVQLRQTLQQISQPAIEPI